MLHVLAYGHPITLTLALGMGATPHTALDAPTADLEALQGRYELRHSGAAEPLCTLRLAPQRTLGGFAVAGAKLCAGEQALPDTPAAWVLRQDGFLLIWDTARRPLLIMQPTGQGEFQSVESKDATPAFTLAPKPRAPQQSHNTLRSLD